MKVEWIKCRSYNITDITEMVNIVTWSGSMSQAARIAEISVLNAPDDKNIANINIEVGDIIKLYDNNENIFFGQVQLAEKLSQYGTVTYSCMDLLAHLLRSTAVYNFKNTTAENITKKVCADFQIESGEIIQSKVPIKKMIVDGNTIYDIIMQAYTKASKQTGDLYICRMEGMKLSVRIKGIKVQNFVLAEGNNITDISYQETIENMINIVKIYDDNGKQIGEVKKDKWIDKYGIYQQVYKKEIGINATTAAKSMITGIEKKVNFNSISGDLKCIAGNAVEVYDKAIGLNGLFWIESDMHVWENGIHTMDLELNFKNIMDKKESEV